MKMCSVILLLFYTIFVFINISIIYFIFKMYIFCLILGFSDFIIGSFLLVFVCFIFLFN